MIVLYQSRIYREDVRANPNALYLFGDNLARAGLGGQAKEMRGEPNAFGIATKRSPAINYPEDYFHDEHSDVHLIIDNEFNRLHNTLREYKYSVVVIPLNGLGTGLSRMPQYAPRALKYLNVQLHGLSEWN